jgi:hypothetical protein
MPNGERDPGRSLADAKYGAGRPLGKYLKLYTFEKMEKADRMRAVDDGKCDYSTGF